MVKIRLARIGRVHTPTYRIVVSDSRRIPTSSALAQLGSYDPIHDTLPINEEEALKWLNNGAIPSDSVKTLLTKKGIYKKFADAKVAAKTAKKD
ncbi:MAG: 30S ribosomal protein S16 [Bacilli bacterium]|nr:30S ribosomal protein S16 [Bacilli bacterium]